MHFNHQLYICGYENDTNEILSIDFVNDGSFVILACKIVESSKLVKSMYAKQALIDTNFESFKEPLKDENTIKEIINIMSSMEKYEEYIIGSILEKLKNILK